MTIIFHNGGVLIDRLVIVRDGTGSTKTIAIDAEKFVGHVPGYNGIRSWKS